ncbi:hypothetical protein L226DRAFT_544371 [Lentinus tigrinus ALCF2SS1-7]|uniref:uncharacterized protein n=1 Tax=Lentinus tigrinus ALCF2SS1-7 TaxID=1328758 RepID=UPI0011661694|nr:hypothetical protein L226DRAFT_544371 [Lentinus tigrinus ALCF2SS1-7]
MSDRGYINLIRHLTRTTSTLPLETLQASIAHYLARPPVPIPGSPTALTATVLGSPLFRPYTYAKLTALAVAFRHAVHLRVAVHKADAEQNPRSILPPSRGVNVCARLGRWVRATLEGFAGSAAVVRLACASGMLLGLQDWEAELKVSEKEARVRAKVEEEVVLALAEVVDTYAREGSGWETDFKKSLEAKGVEEDPLALAVLLASQCAQYVAPERLQALPLPTVIDVLVSTIERSYHAGTFLSQASTGMGHDADGKFTILSKSAFAQAVRSITSSTYIASMASLARFTALSLTVLVESRRLPGWEAIGRTLARLQSLAATVEGDWSKCPLASVSEDSQFADDSTREIATATWQVLKTLLFTNLMVLQSILSAVVFVPRPYGEQSGGPPSAPPTSPSSYTIALDALHTLSHLSFVMPQFGGVASNSESGLPELKRAFYMALDVLSASEAEAGRFVQELCYHESISAKGKAVETLPRVLLDAKKAFALACVEQLVPVLSEAVIQSQVYPLCHPYLWDTNNRETYESAHSVMLAVFASHAKDASIQRQPEPAFAEKVVPMYAHCLVENSFDGRLSTTQLCMAYAALVRSASSFGYASGAQGGGKDLDADSMAWYCIEVLLDAIRHARAAPVKATLPYSPDAQASSSSSSSSPPAPAQESFDVPSEHLHRLHLTLIATVPSVSLTLLPRLLTEVKAIVVSVSAPSPVNQATEKRIEEMRTELVEALFKAISQDVGDAEKDYAIEWWYENREELVLAKAGARHPVFDGVETSAQSNTSPDIVSRL